jgi:MFS family permease
MTKPKNPPSYFSGLSRDTFLLGLASLFSDISSEMLYPVLPIFLTQTLHAGGSIVGIVEGIGQAAQNIFQGFSGWLSDRFQRRKPLALAGYVLGAAAKPLIGLATAWTGVLGARFLDRLGPGIRSAPRDALVASSVDSAHRGKAFGLESAGDNTGAFLGPLVAVWLLAAMHVEIRTIFYLAFIPGVLATLTILLVRERPVRMSAKAKLDGTIAQLPPAYRKYLVVTALFGIGNSSNAFLILRTREAGASLNTTILIYAAFNLVAALSSYPAGYLSDRLGRRDILLLSFVTFLVTYAGFALTQRLDVIVGLFVLYGLYQGIFRSVGKAIATDLVPAHLSASGVGWFGATIGLSGLVASFVAGVMWDRVGHPAVFYYGAASALAGCVALLWLMPSTSRATRAIS